MAQFCHNCGKPIRQGAMFCENCGTKVLSLRDTQQEDTPAQPIQEQYAQPVQPPQQFTQPAQQPQYVNTQKPKKKTGLIIGLIIAGVMTIITIAVIAVIIMPLFKTQGAIVPPTEPDTVSEQTEAATTEAPTTSTTEPQTEAALPYSDSLGKIEAYDFAWIADAQSGNLSGSFISNDDLIGKWKAEFIFDGVWELAYITIDKNANITVEPFMINYGEGWDSEASEPSYTFKGTFDINSVSGSGDYGKMELYQFIESDNVQYGLGSFKVNSGSKADVYLVRP